MRITIFLFLTLYFCTVIYASDPPEFGEVSEEELNLTTFEEDPEADIIILFDRAEIEFDYDFRMIFKRETRIKILSEEGKKNASVRLGYYHKENLTNVEAYSYLPNGEEFELDDDNIIEEQVKNTKFKKFDIPGVEVGSVIEYKYTLYSKYIANLEPWYFQSEAYTKLSQFTIYLPPGFNYSIAKYNWFGNDITPTADKVFRNSKKIGRYRWTANNIPAIKQEPFMTAKKDYFAKILFQLVSVKTRYVRQVFAKTWNDLAESYESYFESKMYESGDHTDFAENFLKNGTDLLEKAQKIYKYIRDNISTDYSGSWYSPRDNEDIYIDKKGSASEKNYLLLNLLKELELEAYPFLISTRNHGWVYQEWPNLDQFNRVIICLNYNKETYYLDTNTKHCPFGHLSPNLEVGIGLKIMGEKAVITKLKPQQFNNLATYNTEININDDGSVDAESHIEYSGYLAIRERNQVKGNDNLKEHVNKKLENYEIEARIDTFYYHGLDSLDEPLKLTIKYKLIEAAEINNNLIFMNTPFITGINNNPYVRETRNFPVNYLFKYKTKEQLSVNFPKNFELSEKPVEVIKRLKKFSYSKITFMSDNSIRYRRIFEIGKKRFKMSEYKDLKNAYDKIIDSDQALIVFENKSEI